MRVLLVDDDPNVRNVLGRILRAQLKLDIEECENGLEAIERLSRDRYDLVLLDVSMPIFDGLEVLQSMRQNPAVSHLPVIMITGAAGEQSVRRAVGQGVSDFLAKPIRPEVLCTRVSRVLSAIASSATGASARSPFQPLESGHAIPVLITDGSAAFRRFFVDAVGSLCPVREAASGVEAVRECLAAAPYAMFIGSDLGIMGEEMLARKIRTLEGCASVRIVGIQPDHAVTTRNTTAFEAVIKRSFDRAVFMEGFGALLRTTGTHSPLLDLVPDLKLTGIGAGREALTATIGEQVVLRAPRSRADAAVVSATTLLHVGPASLPLLVTLNTTPRGVERLRRRFLQKLGLPTTSSAPDDPSETLVAPLADFADVFSQELRTRGIAVTRGESARSTSGERVSIEFEVPADRIWLCRGATGGAVA